MYGLIFETGILQSFVSGSCLGFLYAVLFFKEKYQLYYNSKQNEAQSALFTLISLFLRLSCVAIGFFLCTLYFRISYIVLFMSFILSFWAYILISVRHRS